MESYREIRITVKVTWLSALSISNYFLNQRDSALPGLVQQQRTSPYLVCLLLSAIKKIRTSLKTRTQFRSIASLSLILLQIDYYSQSLISMIVVNCKFDVWKPHYPRPIIWITSTIILSKRFLAIQEVEQLYRIRNIFDVIVSCNN